MARLLKCWAVGTDASSASGERGWENMARVTGYVRQFICGLRGHDALLHFEQGRISLQCTSCGYETPDWDIKGVPARNEAARPHVVQLPLLGQRRVA